MGKIAEQLEAELLELRQKYEALIFEHEKVKELLITLKNEDSLMQTLFASIDDLIFTFDSNGRHVKVFGDTNKVLGVSKEEFIGKSISEIIGFGNAFNDMENIKQVLKGINVKSEGQKKSGDSTVYYETNLAPIKNSQGIIIGGIGVCRNVTEMKNLYKQMKESKAFAENIFEILNALVVKFDVDGNISIFNNIAEEVTGYSRDEVLGKGFFDYIIPKTIYPDAWREFSEWRNDGNPVINSIERYFSYKDYMEQPILTKSGEERIIAWRVNEIIEGGKITGLIEFGSDITELKQIEEIQKIAEENKRLLDEVMEYSNLKTELFANISHELKTPLNVILGAVQLAQMELNNNKIIDTENNLGKYLAYMKQNCFRLVRLVNNLIDSSKMDVGYYKVSLQNCDIISVVEDITLSIAEYVENKGINLVFDTDVEEKVIACDPDKIERVMLNLLSNAIKFTEPGGEIIVNVCIIPDKIIISVKDTGSGIPEEKLGVIFERFVQANKSLTRNHEGSGIGLSIVKNVVELHGGTISAYSKVGKGTEFIIELPDRILNEKENEFKNKRSFITNNKIERINIEFSDIYS